MATSKEHRRRHRANIKADPVRREARLAYVRAWRAKRNADPEIRAITLARARAADQQPGEAEKRRAYYRANLASYVKAEKRRKRRRHAAFLARIYAAIPPYPKEVRDEIAAMIALACIQRTRFRKDLEARVPGWIKDYWRENNQFGKVSLDAPLYEGGPAMIDIIASPEADDGTSNAYDDGSQ